MNQRHDSNSSNDVDSTTVEAPVLVACIVGVSSLNVWGEPVADRMRRSLIKANVERFIDENALDTHIGDVLLVRADVVLDAPVIAALVERPGVVLQSTDPNDNRAVAAHAPNGLGATAAKILSSDEAIPIPAGLSPITSDSLASNYWQSLRKRETPYALRLTAQTLRSVEWRMFMGTYKGATDCVTKWLWPVPACYATRLCIRLGLTPNIVTTLSLALVIAAFYWFLKGDWALGLIAAWLMTFLDTVDGKLARITLTSSRFGNIFDHSIDLVHPPFWYVAWGMGLATGPYSLSEPVLLAALIVIVAGYVLQRVIEGFSIVKFKIEIHIWRRIDTWFRLVTARRNPNLVLLTVATLLGRPDIGLIAVAVWTAVCLLLHMIQLVQAHIAMRKSGPLEILDDEARQPMIKIGVICNPGSQQNKSGIAGIERMLAGRPDGVFAKLEEIGDVADILADFARREVGIVAVAGGDGTVQAVLTEIFGNRPYETPPLLTVLPQGMTNMIADDVGLRHRGERGLAALFKLVNSTDLEHAVCTRNILRMENARGEPPRYGMFFGAAWIYRAIQACRANVHPYKVEAQAAAAVTFAGLFARWLIRGRRSDNVFRGDRIQVTLDDMEKPASDYLLALATTLDRLLLGSRPYWNEGTGGVRFTDIGYPPENLVRNAFRVLYGGPNRRISDSGYHSGGFTRVALDMDCPVTLDGEFYETELGRPVILSADETARFVRV